MTRIVVGVSILTLIVTCWVLIAQTLDERPNEAARQWASQMGRPDHGRELSDEQYRLLGLQSMSGDPIALGQTIAAQWLVEASHPDALPLLDSNRLDALLRCTNLTKAHCAFIPALLAKYQPMLDNYDALSADTRIPFSQMLIASQILITVQSLSFLRIIACLHQSVGDCEQLLRDELNRTRDRISDREYHLEQLIGMVLFDRLVDFIFWQEETLYSLRQDIDLPSDFFASVLSLDAVRRSIKREFEAQLLVVDLVDDMAKHDSKSLFNRWYSRASIHPNRQLNWHHSNYMRWIKLAHDIQALGTTVDEESFEEIDPRLLERVLDFPNAAAMSTSRSPVYFLGLLATAKSRLMLFDQYLNTHPSMAISDQWKNNDFGSRRGWVTLQNDSITCQNYPAMIKTLRPPCIPRSPINSPW